jgi:hypothetical protein
MLVKEQKLTSKYSIDDAFYKFIDQEVINGLGIKTDDFLVNKFIEGIVNTIFTSEFLLFY